LFHLRTPNLTDDPEDDISLANQSDEKEDGVPPANPTDEKREDDISMKQMDTAPDQYDDDEKNNEIGLQSDPVRETVRNAEDNDVRIGDVWRTSPQPNAFNATTTELESLLKNVGIFKVLKSEWPDIAELISENAFGALLLLDPSGYIKRGECMQQIEVTGNSAAKSDESTKNKYGDMMLHALEQIDKTPALASARRSIQNELVNVYYRFAPRWSTGKKSKIFTHIINESGKIPSSIDPHLSQDVFIWRCYGEISMQDVNESNNSFHSHIWSDGKLEFKVIKIAAHRLNALQNALQSDFDQVAMALMDIITKKDADEEMKRLMAQ